MFQNPTVRIMSSIVVPWLLAGILVPISMTIASDLPHHHHHHHRENSMFNDHDPTTINGGGFDLKRIRPESSKSAAAAAAPPPTPTTSANRFASFGGPTVASRPVQMIGQYQTISSSPSPAPSPSQLQLIPIEFPKSINDKIKFVAQNPGGVGGGGGRQSQNDDYSDPQFIQKIIPKLTTALFNSRPFSLADHEDSVVQYRSPNAVMMMDDGRPRSAATTIALPSSKHPAAIQHSAAGLRSQATTKYPSSMVNVGGSQIQMLTNLNQVAKPARPMLSGTSKPRQMYVNHNKSPSSSPRETYMTLSFEQDSDPRISPESPMQAPHHIGSGFYPRQPQQPKMKTIQSLGHTTTHYVTGRLKSPVDRPGPPSSSKVSAYHQQLFNSSPSRPSTGTSKAATVANFGQQGLSQSDPNPPHRQSAGFDYKTTTFGAIRTASQPASTHPMMHPSKSINTPSMTLSFQDDPDSKWNNNQNNMESHGQQQQQSFDWHKSLLGYSKEFGFDMPEPGQINHYDGHDGGKQRYSSSPSILRTVTMNDDAAATPPHGTGVFDDFDDEATMGEGPNFKTAGMEHGSKLSYFQNDDTMKSLFQDDADDGPNFRANSNSNLNFFQEKPIQDVDVEHHPTSSSFGNKSPPDHQLQDLLRKLTEKSSL